MCVSVHQSAAEHLAEAPGGGPRRVGGDSNRTFGQLGGLPPLVLCLARGPVLD